MNSSDDRLLTKIEITVGLPTPEEIGRIIDAFFAANPLSTAYGVIEGDDQGIGEMSPDDVRRFQETAVRYWWLAAARKRMDRPE
jgi:hypothetical protein